jgi:hypothetical protein
MPQEKRRLICPLSSARTDFVLVPLSKSSIEEGLPFAVPMKRYQYWILLAGSCLVFVLLLLQVIFEREGQYARVQVLQAQQVINEGRTCDTRIRQLANRIYQLSLQNQDQGLKDLLTRQQITVNATTVPIQGVAQPNTGPGPSTR